MAKRLTSSIFRFRDRVMRRARRAQRRVPLGFGLVGCIAILLPNLALAQFSMIEDLEPRYEWRGRLGADFLYEFETDTDGGDEFDSWRLGAGGDFGGPINESILMGFHGRYQYAHYDFHLDNGAFPSSNYGTNELPKEPWGDINTIDLAPTTTILVGDRFSVVAAVPIRWSAEVGSDRNAFIAGVSALAGWRVTDDLSVGLGIGISSQIEGDAETFPVIALDWRIREGLRISTEGSWVQGGSAGLYWGPDDNLALAITVGYERNRFRLDDNGTLADTNGVGEVTAVPIEIGLRIRIVEEAYLDLRAGLGVAGRFRVEDDRGHKLYDQEYDPAPRLGIAIKVPLGGSGSRSGSSASIEDW